LIHAGIDSGSAPANRHNRAADRASGSSGSPSLVPSKIPATSASRSARPPASSRSAATAAASFAASELAPLRVVPGLAGELGYQDPVSLRTITEHVFEYCSRSGPAVYSPAVILSLPGIASRRRSSSVVAMTPEVRTPLVR
jgi:hypothetical protein